jgi:Spy/CpxP family protein refolding chaperone
MKIRSTILALAIMAGAAATAGAQQSTAPRNGQRIERSKGDSAKWGKHQRQGRGPRRAMGVRGLLRGVKPTEAQKTQIKAIDQKYQAQLQSIRQANKPAMDSVRAARQRGDTTAARAAFAKTADARKQVETLRLQQANEIRGVLTADQQKTFDANLQKVKARMERQGKRGGRRAR